MTNTDTDLDAITLQYDALRRINRVIVSASSLLDRIDNISTEEFRCGGEREQREELREALNHLN